MKFQQTAVKSVSFQFLTENPQSFLMLRNLMTSEVKNVIPYNFMHERNLCNNAKILYLYEKLAATEVYINELRSLFLLLNHTYFVSIYCIWCTKVKAYVLYMV